MFCSGMGFPRRREGGKRKMKKQCLERATGERRRRGFIQSHHQELRSAKHCHPGGGGAVKIKYAQKKKVVGGERQK